MKLPSMKPPRRYTSARCDLRALPSAIARAGCWLLVVLALCAATGGTGSASAAAVDQDSLAWLVPADAGLVVEVANLAPAAEAFLSGPLGERWQQFPPLRRWWEQNREGTLRMIDDVGRYLQVPPRDIWHDVLGHRVLLAAWPPQMTPGEAAEAPAEGEVAAAPRPTQHPNTLLILRSKQAATLARLVDGFCAAQQRTEQVEWTELTYGDVVIKRGASKQRPDLYVALLDDTAVVSDTRRVVEAAIDLATGRTSRDESLAATAAYRQAAAALPQAVTAWLFIPAPAWNDALAADAAHSTGRVQQEKQQFLALWQGLDSLNVTVQLDRQIAVQALAQFDRTRWPQPIQTLWNAISGPTALPERMPASCLVAIAGKLDLAAVVDAVVGQPGKQPDGWRLVRNGLAMLTGDFGGYLIEGQGELPADWVVAAAVLPQWKDASAAGTPGEFLQVALEEMLGLASLQRPELTVQRGTFGQHTLLVLKHAPEAGPARQIALAVADHWLWAASSPQAVEGALATGSERLASEPGFASTLPKELSTPTGFVFVNAARCRAFLDARGDRLAKVIAEARHQDVDRVSRGLRQLHAVLELCDRAVVATQFTANTARLAITVTAD